MWKLSRVEPGCQLTVKRTPPTRNSSSLTRSMDGPGGSRNSIRAAYARLHSGRGNLDGGDDPARACPGRLSVVSRHQTQGV